MKKINKRTKLLGGIAVALFVILIIVGIWGVISGKLFIKADGTNRVWGTVQVNNQLCSQTLSDYQIMTLPYPDGDFLPNKPVNSFGQFSFTVPNGEYMINAVAECKSGVGEGCMSTTMPVEYPSGTNQPLNLSVANGGTGRLRVAVSNKCSGAPIIGASIWVNKVGGDGTGDYTGTTGSSGYHDFGLVDAGYYNISASAAGYQAGTSDSSKAVKACSSLTGVGVLLKPGAVGTCPNQKK